MGISSLHVMVEKMSHSAQKNVLIPLPATDFDPSESAIPWKILTQRGVQVCFSTPDGNPAQCDQRMLSGNGLGIFSPLLAADKNARTAYQQMERSKEFRNPLGWSQAQQKDWSGLLLPGGHAPGMKPYLESDVLQKLVAEFFISNKPVAAICHGVLLAARSQINGVSVLKNRKTTALLARQELMAWALTCLWLKNYYRTYPVTTEKEVRSCLSSSNDFLSGPLTLKRDSLDNLKAGFTVCDENYLSARWPGDAHKFAVDFSAMLF
ncbi:type 1 glutamine amidotransferase domain-containing protein [Azonexus sp.]|jgi:protease I|uniref:type 1 glutamine amidotransferase domain-containing protein n=1 Tax=Azonexus sp. TaxID=1872668 RepID=UPI0028242E4E|nr:type 1 glutamine amidotransferase domain-containing protein [Azonexus sp.]MDR1994228.1 type 1 glutamine amidotransferase domain-containing protein [Azonexus sp.]